MLKLGWMTVSGCTRAGSVNVIGRMNSFRRLKISEKKLLSKDKVKLRVLAVSVQTRYCNHRSIWANTFAPMGLWQTIPGGSVMVKPIVRETRS